MQQLKITTRENYEVNEIKVHFHNMNLDTGYISELRKPV